ncbi:MFS transporter [Microlunatus parietis]|uniref:MFS family permease n=1 Tax=Microlunatus parietis TaxID=682979 RepID=A0A7Y9LE08_9ACTN|nr:MFS transporter [Microlunatus parietis]NYE72556.1 MFS family permease [Microlunatus parietis]
MKTLWYQVPGEPRVISVTDERVLTRPRTRARNLTRNLTTRERTTGGIPGLVVILAGAFLATGSFFVINVALPTIGRQLGADPGLLPLLVAGYSTPYAALLVAGGRLGDRYGRRRMFVIGAAAFALGTLCCTIAPDFWTLVAARLVQGTAAALLTPQVLGTIQATFSGAARQRAIAWFGSTLGLAAAGGQLLGGVIAEYDLGGLGWRAIFLPLVVVAALLALLAVRLVPETTGQAVKIDILGGALLALPLILLLLPLSLGARLGWPVWTWLSLLAAVPAVVIFVAVERRIEAAGRMPLLPPSLFALRPFRRGLVTALAFFLGLGGFFLVIGFVLQGGLGLGALGAALVLTPYALGFLACSMIIPWLVRRFGVRVIIAGAAILVVANLIIAVRSWLTYPTLSGTSLLPELIMLGIGQSLVMIPVFGQVLAQLPAERAGTAAGVLTTTQQIGIALGAAVFGAVLFAEPHGPVHSPGWAWLTAIVFAGMAVLAGITALCAGVGGRGDERRMNDR